MIKEKFGHKTGRQERVGRQRGACRVQAKDRSDACAHRRMPEEAAMEGALPQPPPREHGPADTFIADFRPPPLRGNACLFV